MMPAVAVFDVGKTNVKLNIVGDDGAVIETHVAPNRVVSARGWRRHALAETEAWLLDVLAAAAKRWRLTGFISSGHGSAGVLVKAGEINAPEPALPMPDYEQALPEAVRQAYAGEPASFFDRGSAVMLGATHQARQMAWVEAEDPQAFKEADAFLGVPQYWAWRLSGVMAAEVSYLGAQSHLWNVPEARSSAIVARRGWGRLMPPMRKAYDVLGPVRADLADTFGLPRDMAVLAGVHDSSANFFRYQASGLSGFTVVSTGTWIVALSDHADLSALDEARGMTCNADVEGRPLGGCLTMGGREFSLVAGDQPEGALAEEGTVARLVSQGTMALPSFFKDDGLFPGSAERGRIDGPPPADARERLALAVLYSALLTAECLEALACRGLVVLDGSFLRDPLYARLLAALLPRHEVRFNRSGDGIASGAALLAARGIAAGGGSAPLDLPLAEALRIEGLDHYAARWRAAAPRRTAS